MIADLLQEIAPNCIIDTMQENFNYGFSIKVAKDPSWNYYIVFTDGLSNTEQDVPPKYEAFKKLELYFCLPDYWELNNDTWPIDWLEKLAEIPQKNNTWFGPGDTIPAGNPPKALSDRFPANNFMLVEPLKVKDVVEDPIFKTAGIQFMGIIPISQEELDYKIRNSATVLMARLVKNNYTELVDLFRQAVCRKRFLNFF